jgi:ABC-2 type transport system permease protein
VTAVAAPPEMHPSVVAQTAALSRRAIVGTFRQLPLLLPSLIFPMFFVAINAASFQKSLPLLRRCCYPSLNSFVTFMLPATVIQGVLFGSVQSATDLANDVEGGFFERLLASPVNRVSILVGRLAGAAVISVVQTVFFVALLSIFGARNESGVPGYLVLVVCGALVAVGFGALLASISIKSGSAEAVQSTFPVVFVLLFASSAFFPRQTMKGWFKTAAGWNPLSHLIESLRVLSIGGWSTHDAAIAIAVSLSIVIVGVAFALLALRRRLAASS